MDKKVSIYIIQEILSGCTECPTIFLDEKEADKFFLRLVEKVHGKKFKNVDKAGDFLRAEEEGNDHLIKYWVTPPVYKYNEKE